MSTTYRERCLRVKGRECLLCGSEDSLDVHHVDGDRSNNSLNNLVPVCKTCHARIHSGSDGYEDWYQELDAAARRHAPSAKDQYEGIYIFLPDELLEEFNIAATEMNTQRQRRNGKHVEKIRHYEPLMVSLALEKAEELDDDELEDRLAKFDP